MPRTISERVLRIAKFHGEFNKNIAKKSFKVYDNEYIHNSVMRAARELSDDGLLRRKGRGNYVPR